MVLQITSNFTIRATDAEGQTADRAFSITINLEIDSLTRYYGKYLFRTKTFVFLWSQTVKFSDVFNQYIICNWR